MSDLAITPSGVFASSGAIIISSQKADVELTAGAFVYLTSVGGVWRKILRNLVNSAADNAVRGITLNHAYAGQIVIVAIRDPAFTVGATLVPGTTYAIGIVGGALAPFADLTTGSYPVVAGVAISTTQINLWPTGSGIPVP